MRVYHATKTECAYKAISRDRVILHGENVETKTKFVHISMNPFTQGTYTLDVIGADTNEAWILECEIPDDTALVPDPADDAGDHYNGGWRVSESVIPILKIYSVTHIKNVIRWEGGEDGYERKL